MGWHPGLAIVILTNVGLFAVALAGLLYLHRRAEADSRQTKQAWYDEADALAGQVRTTAESVETPIDQDQLQRDIIPLAPQLKSHARAAPEGVDAVLVRDVHELGVACYEIGMEHATYGATEPGVFLEEKLETLAETAADLETAVDARG